MTDLTIRHSIQLITGLLVLVGIGVSLFIMWRRPLFRWYTLPVLLLLLDFACVLYLLIANAYLYPIPQYVIIDWSTIFMFHTVLTLLIYIVWMPLLRR